MKIKLTVLFALVVLLVIAISFSCVPPSTFATSPDETPTATPCPWWTVDCAYDSSDAIAAYDFEVASSLPEALSDITGNGNGLTVINTPTLSIGTGLVFDGSNDCLSSSIAMTSPLSLFVEFANVSNTGALIGSKRAITDQWPFNATFFAGFRPKAPVYGGASYRNRFSYYLTSTTPDSLVLTGTLGLAIYPWGGTGDGNGVMYANGVNLDDNFYIESTTDPLPMFIGCWDSTPLLPISATIKRIAVYKITLSDDDFEYLDSN